MVKCGRFQFFYQAHANIQQIIHLFSSHDVMIQLKQNLGMKRKSKNES